MTKKLLHYIVLTSHVRIKLSNVTKELLYVMLKLHNEIVKCEKKVREPPNVRKKTVTCHVGTIKCEDGTVQCEKKVREPPNVTKELSHVKLELHNVRMKSSNVRKRKRTTKCEKKNCHI